MMNLIPSFLRKSPPAPQSATTLNNPGWLTSWASGGGQVPLFGNAVSEETSMAVAAVYRCVTLLSGTTASLDLGIFTNDPELGQVPVTNKISRLFKVNPFPGRQMTSFTWKELLVMNILLHGNAFTVIRFDNAGRISALEYTPPWTVTVTQLNQRNHYKVRWQDGRAEEMIDQDSMLHIPGPGFNGVTGMSRIRQNARNSVAMARSIEEVMGKAHDNAMQPKIVMKLPSGMSPDAIKRLQLFVDTEFSGKSNVGKTLLLDAGTEIDSMSISVVDLALLDAMKASTIEICAFFGVPPLLLGIDQTTSFGTGISSLLIAFLRFGLNSELERIEAELTSKLCTGDQYVLFDRDQLLAMDAATAAEVAAREISCGMSTINEVRRAKHKPAVEGGDVPLTNAANVPLSQAILPRQSPPPPSHETTP